MTTTTQRQPAVCHASAAYAGLPGPVTFDPPVAFADAKVPSCPSCGEGTEFLLVCGKCGSTEPGPGYCCGRPMLVRGAYVSVLPCSHSWLGCAIVGA